MLAPSCLRIYDMIIKGHAFPHNIKKTNRISPDGRTQDQINHICMGQTRSYDRYLRGANTGFDHHMVLARIMTQQRGQEEHLMLTSH